MENSFKNLSLQTPISQIRLASNVYKVRTSKECVVHKFLVSVDRLSKEEKKYPVKTNGPEPLRIIKSRVTREVLRVMISSPTYRGMTVFFDGQEALYSNSPLFSEAQLTEKIETVSMKLNEEDKRIVLRDSPAVLRTLKPDAGLSNIPYIINQCDREEINLINFYSSLVKSSAPDDRFISMRGGRLFDLDTFNHLPGTGMLRGQGVKIGTKLIGNDQLSVSFDIDSKEGTFFKPQPLIDSIAEHFNCDVRAQFTNYNNMRDIERYIRDIAVREEGTDRVFSIGGFKWGEREGGEKYLLKLSDICDDLVKRRQYGMDPVVVEEHVTKDGKIVYNDYALTTLHIIPYSKVPLAKQNKENRPPALPPSVRYQKIDKARKDIRISEQNENLKGFETEIATKPVCPLSEILPAPTIYARGRNGQPIELAVHATKHSYNSNPFQFVVPARISYFLVVYDLAVIRNEEMAKKFCDQLFGVCTSKGMYADGVEYKSVECKDELESELKSLAVLREGETRNGIVPVAFVLCLGFPKHHDLLKYAEHKYKVVCQQVMADTVERVIRKPSNDTLANIAKKINEKCGGTNIEVKGPIECASIFPLRADPTTPVSLIIGMDVCHGDPLSKHLEIRGIKPDPSIIGISSNALSKNPQMYTGDFIATKGRRESVPDSVMSDHGRFLTRKFFENHGKLPDNVILVRDGVARSQYEMAVGEFSAFMEGVKAFASEKSSNFDPRELLIITTKEHNLRLFDKVEDKVCNPRPGTVVDSDIVSPFLPEFFIIPQDAFSGTAKGVLVTILKDGQKDLRKYPRESLNEMKHFIHSLTFLHGISGLPNSLPEPASVAHDLAERGATVAKQMRYYTGEHPSYEQLTQLLTTRGTSFEGLKFTA